MNKTALLAWSLLATLAFIWGSSFILMKKGLIVFSPLEIGAIRIAVAFVVLLPFALQSIRKVPTHKWKYLLVPGLIGNTIPAFLFPLAQTQLLSSVTGVLNALTPLFTVIVGTLFFSQVLNYKQITGLGIAFFGAALLSIAKTTGGFGEWNAYVIFVLLATLCYGISLNVIKHKLSDMPSLRIASTSFFLVGFPMVVYLFAATPFLNHFANPAPHSLNTVWLSFAYIAILAVFGTAIALVMFNKLIQLTDAIFTSTVTYFIPIVAIFWGVWDDEPLVLGHYLGMVLIILGVFITNRWK